MRFCSRSSPRKERRSTRLGQRAGARLGGHQTCADEAGVFPTRHASSVPHRAAPVLQPPPLQRALDGYLYGTPSLDRPMRRHSPNSRSETA